MIKSIKKQRLCNKLSRLLDEFTVMRYDWILLQPRDIVNYYFCGDFNSLFLHIHNRKMEFVVHYDNIIKMKLFTLLDKESITELLVKKYNKNSFKVIIT